MSDTVNRRWLLAAHPTGRPLQKSDFDWREEAIPEPGEGEVLLRSLWFSCDPAQKGWLENIGGYVAPTHVGDPVRAFGVGQVVKSRSPRFSEGDLVQGMLRWEDYLVLPATPGMEGLNPVVLPDGAPLHMAVGALGITTMTAYFGLLDIGRPKPGDTVLVSGAAGATGSAAAQIAKIAGARVIGIAGGPEKCRYLTDELGLDGAIDYKAGDVKAAIKQHCRSGIDVFYDNVGGDILNLALGRLAMNARVVICGGISRYEADGGTMPKGPENYFNLIFTRSRMEGFLIFDYADKYPAATKRCWQWMQEGRLKIREDVAEGLENAPQALMGLFRGANTGKQLLKVADPQG